MLSGVDVPRPVYVHVPESTSWVKPLTLSTPCSLTVPSLLKAPPLIVRLLPARSSTPPTAMVRLCTLVLPVKMGSFGAPGLIVASSPMPGTPADQFDAVEKLVEVPPIQAVAVGTERSAN